jgi:hypothetical protein
MEMNNTLEDVVQLRLD